MIVLNEILREILRSIRIEFEIDEHGKTKLKIYKGGGTDVNPPGEGRLDGPADRAGIPDKKAD